MTRKKAQQIQEPRPFLVMTERITWKSIATEPGKPACTLLIPAALEAFLRRRYKEHGPLIAYLAYLLGRAALYRAQGRLPEVKRVTRKYQEECLDLQKWHVRIPGELWTELRCVAGGSGVTMTHMFVILVLLDKEDLRRRQNVGAPAYWGLRISFMEGVDIQDGKTRRKIRYVVTGEPPPRLLIQIR